jgi:hypothetical protein
MGLLEMEYLDRAYEYLPPEEPDNKAKLIREIRALTPELKDDMFYNWKEALSMVLPAAGIFDLDKLIDFEKGKINLTQVQDQMLYLCLLPAVKRDEHVVVLKRAMGSGILAIKGLETYCKRFLETHPTLYDDALVEAIKNLPPGRDNLDPIMTALRRTYGLYTESGTGGIHYLVERMSQHIPCDSPYYMDIKMFKQNSKLDIEMVIQQLRDTHKVVHFKEKRKGEAEEVKYAYKAHGSLTKPDQTLEERIEELQNLVKDMQTNIGNNDRPPMTNGNPCGRCGGRHDSRICPCVTRNTKCFGCGKIGHLQRVCKSSKKEENPSLEENKPLNANSSSVYIHPVRKTQETIIDSGCTKTIVTERDLMSSVTSETPSKFQGLSETVQAQASGTATFLVKDTLGNVHALDLPAELVPEASMNLISVASLCHLGHQVRLENEKPHIILDNKAIVPLIHHNDLYILDHEPNVEVAAISKQLAHQRLMHRNDQMLRDLEKCDPTMSIDNTKDPLPPCYPCAAGKMKCNPIPKKEHDPRASGPYQAFSIDLSGQKEPSRYGNRYYLVCTDLYSGVVDVVFSKTRTGEDLVVCIKQWLRTWLLPSLSRQGIRMYCDGEFLHGPVLEFLHQEGIVTYGAAPYEHATNPAERSIGLVYESVVAALTAAGLPTNFWEDAAKQHVYMANRTPKGRRKQVPLLKANPHCPYADTSKLRTFGCLVAFRRPNRNKGMFQKKCILGLNLGNFGDHTHGTYRILSFETQRTIYSRSVKFFENVFPGEKPNISELCASLRMDSRGSKYGSPVTGSEPSVPSGPAWNAVVDIESDSDTDNDPEGTGTDIAYSHLPKYTADQGSDSGSDSLNDLIADSAINPNVEDTSEASSDDNDISAEDQDEHCDSSSIEGSDGGSNRPAPGNHH